MKYLSLIAILSRTIACASNQIKVVTGDSAYGSASPSSLCATMGYQPYMLYAQDVPVIMAALKAQGIDKAVVSGWNGEKIEMVIGSAAGDVTPLAEVNKTRNVLCVGSASSGSTQVPTQSQPGIVQAPGPVVAPTPNMVPPMQTCPSPAPTATTRPAKKCVAKRRWRPCDSPCVVNYPNKKVFIIDELTAFCGFFVRIVETKCKLFARERIWTVSKMLPPYVTLPFPSVLRQAALLHKILCEARDQFDGQGCVCLFIDNCNKIYITVDGEYRRVLIRKKCSPCPMPFPPVVTPRPGFGFPPCPPCPPRMPFPMCPPEKCNPCCGPIVKCKPAKKVDQCNRPCPPDFEFCPLSCEETLRLRRRGLYAVLFSRCLDL
ncbi:hypothetical protein NEOKW01_0499 [Nematocida sp. AWRm80]|nr:hypothetical protein NEOKW01_0499 [Nematocida sp. AWRm80]